MPVHHPIPANDPESLRIANDPIKRSNWKLWGPYLSERQWGTVREDYSENGTAWESFPREQAGIRAYRWGEDGLMGWSDRHGQLCFSVTLWNEQDEILKERLFGLTNHEGNHGEDVKELYYYLDSTPTHSFARSLYKYPQRKFPYQEIITKNKQLDRLAPEYEIEDTGIFSENRFFDVETIYSKAGPEDLLIEIRATNRGPETAPLVLLPTLWFRNTWSWGREGEDMTARPEIRLNKHGFLETEHEQLPAYQLAFEEQPELWFTDNETHRKDAFSRHLLTDEKNALRSDKKGSKSAGYYRCKIESGKTAVLRMRLTRCEGAPAPDALFGENFSTIVKTRREEADQFYQSRIPDNIPAGEKLIMRQAFAGLLWSKQFYHFIINDWLDGDPTNPAPLARRKGRNNQWNHLFNRDVISMPDKWEYPWYAAWDLAFHMLPMAEIDPHFAKHQLSLFLREWYMHPNGQLPAYEWNFSDVNPPVHAWGVWRVYKIAQNRHHRDLAFLASSFKKLLINFTWWVNRKDPNGKNVFAGGFLGLDNIGVFDRSHGLPYGAALEQADGTAWMASYCTTMLSMALELAEDDVAYEDLASKFFEHYATITLAINGHGRYDGLWCEEDGFYYDWLTIKNTRQPLKVRSLVGLLPLIAVEILDQDKISKLTGFNKRTNWFLKYRPHLADSVSSISEDGKMRLLSVCPLDRFRSILKYLFDENEFLSPFGIRSLSKFHEKNPFTVTMENGTHSVAYTPGESDSPMFGGNSNWRGPIWFPINYLIIEALERYHHFYGDDFKVEFPTGSGNEVTLAEAARLLGERLRRLFQIDPTSGSRPAHGQSELHRCKETPEQDLVLFYEYFNAETGEGLGASHQTGWTALISRLIRKGNH
ncbi:MAG: glucosidase [Verrucomicrobiales bacterium]|nr:glucosidase [Verrucomicrobiales bacterium]